MKQNYFTCLLLAAVISVHGQQKKKPAVRITKKQLESMVPTRVPNGTASKKTSDATAPMMNFNPVFFDSDQPDVIQVAAEFNNLANATVFTVYKTYLDAEQELWRIRTPEADIALSTDKAYNADLSTAFVGGTGSDVLLNTFVQNYKPTKKKKPNNDNGIEFGSFSGDETKKLKGQIAEVLVYNNILTPLTLQMVESGLSLKYGFSLQNEKNYISSEETVIYDVEKHPTFKNRIFGIGRDDWNSLYQKQSRMSTETLGMVVSLGTAANTNEANLTQMNDQNFLVFGDNDGTLEIKSATDGTNCLPMLDRKWLVEANGDQAGTFSTNITLDTKNVFPESQIDAQQYLLVVDKSGTGNFNTADIQYIKASSLENGRLTFKDIHWDADGSGNDQFGFTLRQKLNVDLKQTASLRCDTDNAGELSYQIQGGIPPYTLSFKEPQGAAKEWSQSDYTCMETGLADLKEATYTLTVKDSYGESKNFTHTFFKPIPATVELGADQQLTKDKKTITLTPQVKSLDDVTYLWTSDNGFSSNSAQPEISQPGIYTLSVCTSKGCTTTDTIMITSKVNQSLMVYPTISNDGRFNVEVSLDKPEPVTVNVFDMTGKSVYSTQLKSGVYHKFPISLQTASGSYLVNIKTASLDKSTKIIVK